MLLNKKIISLFILCVGFIYAQECDECSTPRVAMYDFDVQVELPAIDTLANKWPNLFYTGVEARYATRYTETKRDCILWLDGALINAEKIQNGTLLLGNTYTNLPPAGSMDYTDYVLWGSVSKNGSVYTATLKLETGPSRELVKSVSSNFTNPDDAFSTGDILSGQFGSIWQTIKDFEIYKRSSDKMVAIKDKEFLQSEELTISPESSTVNVGDTVNVEFQLIDCDGEPLAGRTIHLSEFNFEGDHISGPVNGNFTDEQVVTDSEGKACSKFTPSSTGVAVASANFPHYKPTGASSFFFNEAILNVPPETVEVEGLWKMSYEEKGDTSWTVSQEGTTLKFNSSTRVSEVASGKIKVVLQRDYSIPIKVYTNVVYLTSNAKYSLKDDFYKDFTVSNIGGTYTTIDIDKRILSGSKINEPYVGVIYYDNNEDSFPEVMINGEIVNGGADEERSYSPETGWYNSSSPVDDNLSFSMNFHESNMDDKQLVQNGDNYTYSYKIEEKLHNSGTISGYHGHALDTYYTEEWKINLNLKGTHTSIRENTNYLPSEFSLSQNYPNPFNPVTTIKYSIPVGARYFVPVQLKVYNLLGQEVATLVNKQQVEGNYEVKFDGSPLPSGTYFYRLTAGNFSQCRKMILMK